MNRVVNPPELPKPSGFSHAVVAGNTVYLAGRGRRQPARGAQGGWW
jgi:enamine deaminase RidA (YjgF/YER057c/UK114 family)